MKAQEARVRRARISEETKIVAAVIDKVLSDVERLRAKSRRSSRVLQSPAKSSERRRPPSPVRTPESFKTKHRRERKVATYKEESSDSEKSSDELKQKTPKKSTSRRNIETIVRRSPTPKLVVVKVSNDEHLSSVTDIAKSHVKSLNFDDNDQNSTGDLSTEDEEGSSKPSLDCPRILKRLQTTLVTEMLTPLSNDVSHSRKTHSRRYQHPLEVKISALSRMENGEDHADIATDLNITVSTLGAWWIRRSDIKVRYENKLSGGPEDTSSERERKGRNRSRSLGPQEGKLSRVGSDQDLEENLPEKRKRSVRLSVDSLGRAGSSAKNVYSLEFKMAVIERLRAGEEIAEVAKSLAVRENTVSVWWVRRDRIEKRQRLASKAPEDPEDLRPRPRRSAVASGRWMMPVEVKQTAIRRLEAGVTQAVVARDLDVSLSTVASWWRKKDNILATGAESADVNHENVEDEEDVKADDAESVEEVAASDKVEDVAHDDSNEEAPLMTIDDLGVSELEHLMSDTDHSEDKQTVQAAPCQENQTDTNAELSEEVTEANQDDATYHNEDPVSELQATEDDPTLKLEEDPRLVVENDPVSESAKDPVLEPEKDLVSEQEEGPAREPEPEREDDPASTLEEDPELLVRKDPVSEPEEDSASEPERENEAASQPEEDPVSEPEEVSGLLGGKDPVEDPEEELESEPEVEMKPLTSTPRPQSGLGLILSSYCSSEDEL